MNPVHYSTSKTKKTPVLERGALDRGELPPRERWRENKGRLCTYWFLAFNVSRNRLFLRRIMKGDGSDPNTYDSQHMANDQLSIKNPSACRERKDR